VKAYCGLTRQQAALYEQVVRDLQEKLESMEGHAAARPGAGAVDAPSNRSAIHPAQMLVHGEYDAKHSGKFPASGRTVRGAGASGRKRRSSSRSFARCRAEPLARFLEGVFGRPGLVLHGGVAVAKRRDLVNRFQHENGPAVLRAVRQGGAARG